MQPQGLTTRQADPAKVKQLLGNRVISFTITTYQGSQGEQTYARRDEIAPLRSSYHW